MATVEFSQDDIFVISKICASAIGAGVGDVATGLMAFLQEERPENAGGFILAAMQLSAENRPGEAADFLELSGAFEAPVSGEEARAYHLILLAQAGRTDQARRIAVRLLQSRSVVSETALAVIRRHAAARPAPPRRPN